MKIEAQPPTTRGGLRSFKLLEDFTWSDGHITPSGFVWNGASAPFGRQRALIASCRHDEDYDAIVQYILNHQTSRHTKHTKEHIKLLKDTADMHFKQNMRQYDFQHQFLCWIFYLGVRLPFIGGGKAIRDAVKEKQNGKG